MKGQDMTDKPTRRASRSRFIAGLVVASTALAVFAPATQAQQAAAPVATAAAKTGVTADVFIKNISTEVLNAIRADKSLQSGDTRKVVALVDTKVLPT
jgi:phospholipid transport system substrate-binding protein